MAKLALLAGSVAGMLAVVLGAFGAHALKARLEPAQLDAYQTAVNYQMYHALALLLTGLLLLHFREVALLHWASLLFIAGIVLFSGSLYLLTLTDMRWPGPITPLGGLSFIAAWLCLAVAGVRSIG